MELKRCNHLCFIKVIRAGLVEKIRNVDSRGRPALVLKSLEDISNSEDAKKLDSPSTIQSQHRSADMVFNSDRVKFEGPCLPTVERKRMRSDVTTAESNFSSDDDEEDGESDDLDCVELTLKQLKEQCKTSKSKVTHTVIQIVNKDYTDWKPEEDETDLNEPISCWKTKYSKNLKADRKRAKKCASSSPQTVGSVKPEQILSEDFLQSSGYLSALTTSKHEVSAIEYAQCRNTFCVAGDDSIACESTLFQEVSCEIKEAAVIEPESRMRASLTKEMENCGVNEISYDHLEHIQPDFFLPSVGGYSSESDNLEKSFQPFWFMPVSEVEVEGCTENPLLEESSPETLFPDKDQSSDRCYNSQSYSSAHEISTQTSGISELSGVEVPDVDMDSSICCMELSSAGDTWKSEDDIHETLPPNLHTDGSLSGNSVLCIPEFVLFSVEDDPPATENLPAMSANTDAAATNCSSSTTLDKKQLPTSPPDNGKKNSPQKNHQYDALCKLSAIEISHHTEQFHPPERLLSTRKAISPVSQEKLFRALKGIESKEDTHHYECKEKLQLGKDTENKTSVAGPETEVVEVHTDPEGLGDFCRTKVASSLEQIPKELKNDIKGSPTKSIQSVRRLPRSLPPVNTGRTSNQTCSERAIAFSQQQMHDIERLAMALMQELKSMKAIAERTLQSEASPTSVLKYDVDEVKTAIKSAAKAEEKSRKWLSMMTRDCTRFCKLMSLTEKGEIASGTPIHKGRRKISFADEAGGVLCRVQFVDSTAPLDS